MPQQSPVPKHGPEHGPEGGYPELSLDALDFLTSPQAVQALAHLKDADISEANQLHLLMILRQTFSREQAAALLIQARLRERASRKFADADRLLFTSEALEQATAQAIADYRAGWIHRHAPPGPILDLGCGIGGDSLALARHRPVIAYDIAADRLALAQANAAALDLPHPITFRLADWTADLADGRLPQAAAAFADPARRVEGVRRFGLDQMQPPIQALLALALAIPHLGVKVAPGVGDDELPPQCSVEFISHEGVCKEATLWFGDLRGEGPGRRAAVHSRRTGQWQVIPADGAPPPLGPLRPGQMLYEPDPALIRAGPFAWLCEQLGAHLFDPQIAYLVGPPRPLAPDLADLVQRVQIDEVLPGGLRGLNRRLHALGIGQVELKKRGFPAEPESLRPRLQLTPGGRDAVILFTRYQGERVILLGRRVWG